MRRLSVLLIFMVPLSGWAYIWVPSSPKVLQDAETILFVPATRVKVSYLNATPGVAIVGPIKKAWEIQSPMVLKGSVGEVVRLKFIDLEFVIPPLATNYLIFLKGNGESVKPVASDIFAIGLTGDSDALGKELGQVQPDVWHLISRCLIDEQDPACALHQSYILSEAPPDVLQTTWEAVKERKRARPDLWLAYQNIGVRVDGVSALNGFVEPDLTDGPAYDPTYIRYLTGALLGPITSWFYGGSDHEDYRKILDFVRGQRGRVGAAALRGITHSTQKRDLPELLDIFEHSPSVDIRYACLEHFDSILGHPQPPEVIGWGEFKKRPAKYTRIWKARVQLALAH